MSSHVQGTYDFKVASTVYNQWLSKLQLGLIDGSGLTPTKIYDLEEYLEGRRSHKVPNDVVIIGANKRMLGIAYETYQGDVLVIYKRPEDQMPTLFIDSIGDHVFKGLGLFADFASNIVSILPKTPREPMSYLGTMKLRDDA